MSNDKKLDNICFKSYVVNSLDLFKDTLSEAIKSQGDTASLNPLSITFITATSFITGEISKTVDSTNEILVSNPSDSKSFTVDYSYVIKLVNDNLKEFKTDNENLKIFEKTGIINLKNVTIKPLSNPNNSVSLDQMFLFTDQILGCSLGHPQNPSQTSESVNY